MKDRYKLNQKYEMANSAREDIQELIYYDAGDRLTLSAPFLYLFYDYGHAIPVFLSYRFGNQGYRDVHS